MPKPADQQCDNCQYWLDTDPKSECRRFPPLQQDAGGNSVWPITIEAGWCGEWEAIPKPPQPTRRVNVDLSR